jgi:hypothetical protein
MKKTMSFVIAAAVMVFAASCGGSKSNSPADIEKTIYAQFQKGNYEKGMELYFANIDGDSSKDISTDDKAKEAEMVKAFAAKAKESIDAKGGIKNFEIVAETISEDGETARVESKTTYGDGSTQDQTSKYVKKDGEWKIVFGK